MNCDLQKASMMKRVSAWLLDAILFCVLAAGCFWAISAITGYDGHSAKLEEYYTQYETEFGVTFDFLSLGVDALTEAEREAYNAMTEAEQSAYRESYTQACNDAYQAMIANDDMVYTYNLVLQLTVLMLCIGIFLARLLLDFVVPLLFGNGQTVGKKIFSLAVMRTGSIRISAVSLFIRTILGKYAIETMIPAFIVTMWLLGIMGIGGTIIVAVLMLAQLILVITTPTNALIHDKLADTVVVEMSSQMIFHSQEDKVAYQKMMAAEQADQQTY